MFQNNLYESLKFIIDFFNSSPIGLSVIASNNELFVNSALCELVGYSSEYFQENGIDTVVHPEDRKDELSVISNITSGKIKSNTRKKRFVHKNGHVVWLDIFSSAYQNGENDVHYIISLYQNKESEILGDVAKSTPRTKFSQYGVLKNLHDMMNVSTRLIDQKMDDISYQKILENMVNITQAKYGVLYLSDENNQTFSTKALAGNIRTWEKGFKLIGYELIEKCLDYNNIKTTTNKEDIITKFNSISELAGSEFTIKVTSKLEKYFNTGSIYIIKIIKEERILGNFSLIFEKDKWISEPELAKLYSRQVGLYIERERNKNELLKNEEKYRYLFSKNPQPMLIYDINTFNFIEVNESMINFLGYSKEEFLEMKIDEIFIDFDKNIVEKFINTPGTVYNKTWKHKKKNGEIVYIEATSVNILLGDKTVRQVLIHDITAQKKAEIELNNKINELLRFQKITIDREFKMIELKKEINDLLIKQGEQPKYKIVD